MRRLSGSAPRGWRLAAAVAGSVLAAAPALAQPSLGEPEEIRGITIEQKLGAEIPRDARFVDESGRTVRLGDFLRDGRPVVLNLVYYSCPMLCNLVLNGLTDALGDMSLVPGRDFEVVSISIKPTETPSLALEKKKNYFQAYGKPEAFDGWHFLTGEKDQIRRVADAVGFRYRYLPDRDEYAHAAGQIIVSPEGRVTRYLPGVLYDPKTLRLSLVEASNGAIGSLADQAFLTCFRYDASVGAYTATAMGVMRIAGALSVFVVGTVLLILWRLDVRRRRRFTAHAEPAR